MLTETEVQAIKPLRYSRKVSDGGGLYLLVTPKGGRCWRYAFRFAQKHKTLALGVYPDVSLDSPDHVTGVGDSTRSQITPRGTERYFGGASDRCRGRNPGSILCRILHEHARYGIVFA